MLAVFLFLCFYHSLWQNWRSSFELVGFLVWRWLLCIAHKFLIQLRGMFGKLKVRFSNLTTLYQVLSMVVVASSPGVVLLLVVLVHFTKCQEANYSNIWQAECSNIPLKLPQKLTDGYQKHLAEVQFANQVISGVYVYSGSCVD